MRMKQRLRLKMWWPGVDRAIEGKCKVCHGFQAQPPPPEPMRHTEFRSEPWCDLAGGLLGPLPAGEYLLVVVDYYSRYFEVAILKSVTSRRIIDALETMFSTHGIPNSMKQTTELSSSWMKWRSISKIMALSTEPLPHFGPKQMGWSRGKITVFLKS